MSNLEQAKQMLASGSSNEWNCHCLCNKCSDKAWLKLDLMEFSAQADKLGFDLADKKQLRKFQHDIIQKGGM